MMRKRTRLLSSTETAAFAAALVWLTLPAFAQHSADATGAAQALTSSGDYRGTHDPSIAKDGETYYVFATGAATPAAHTPAPADAAAKVSSEPVAQLPVRCSMDLKLWTRCGAVFPSMPKWIHETSPSTKELWAPDISYFDRLFHLYYAFSAFGKNTSGIALATNETLDPASPKYKWIDRGLVLRSKEKDDFNAIDPNLVIDQNGEAWLAFGSFWTGIKMRHLDRHTGLLSSKDTQLYSLASRAVVHPGPRDPGLPPDAEAIEAPFVFQHQGFFYLFVSWDLCCRGLKSTYRTMVGRSRAVTGPFVDRDGKLLTDGGGTPLLRANSTWLGPGGASLVHLPAADLIAFHAYSAIDGKPALQLSTINWKDGWPAAALEGDKP